MAEKSVAFDAIEVAKMSAAKKLASLRGVAAAFAEKAGHVADVPAKKTVAAK